MSVVASLLVALVVGVSPFWLGSNRPLVWSANALAIGVVLLLASVSYWREARRYPALMLSELTVPAVLFGLGICWAGLQMIPLGSLDAGHPAWSVAAEALGRDVYSSISVNRSETLWAILRYLTAASVLFCVYVLARRVSNARIIQRTFVVLTGLMALYGLLRLSLSLDKILWFDEPDTGYLTSGFINRNSAATFLGMGSLVGLGLMFQQIRSVFQKTIGESDREGIRRLSDALAGRLGLDLVLFVLMFVALLATGSRGGISFTVIAALFMMLLYSVKASVQSRSAGGRSAWVLIILLVAVLMIGLFELSGARLVGRLLDQGFGSASRVETYVRTLEAIRDYLFLGSGLGTFQDVFTAYRLELSAGRHVWDKAHNDYLELILGLGLPAATLVMLSYVFLFYKVVRGFFVRHRDGHYSAIAAAVCVLVGLHSLVDFSLQIQANTLAFALLLGLGLAQSKSSRN